MKANRLKHACKNVVGALALPVIMYVAMMIFCFANNKMYFGSLVMWRSLVGTIAASATCAYGIGLQFKSGRLDFSAGAVMLLSAIVAGNVAQICGNNPFVFAALCMILCVLLNIGVALVYVYGRLPIIIATLGMALLYESITAVVFDGRGVNLTANVALRQFSIFPMALIPLVASVLIYAAFSYLSITGRQAQVLANNQQAGVNIGINERRNILISYIYSGAILGFATMVYASTGIINASFSSLSTIGGMFTNLLPVFVGLILSRFCGDTIGILLGVIAMSLMNFAMEAVLTAELGSAVTTMMTGVFLLLINVADAKGPVLAAWLKQKFNKGTQSLEHT